MTLERGDLVSYYPGGFVYLVVLSDLGKRRRGLQVCLILTPEGRLTEFSRVYLTKVNT